jgi:hypothetical protein
MIQPPIIPHNTVPVGSDVDLDSVVSVAGFEDEDEEDTSSSRTSFYQCLDESVSTHTSFYQCLDESISVCTGFLPPERELDTDKTLLQYMAEPAVPPLASPSMSAITLTSPNGYSVSRKESHSDQWKQQDCHGDGFAPPPFSPFARGYADHIISQSKLESMDYQ